MNFCTKCGRPLGSAQNFCPGCRAPLPDTANGVPPSTATSSQPAAPSHAATHASLGGNQQATEGASAPAPHAGPAATTSVDSRATDIAQARRPRLTRRRAVLAIGATVAVTGGGLAAWQLIEHEHSATSAAPPTSGVAGLRGTTQPVPPASSVLSATASSPASVSPAASASQPPDGDNIAVAIGPRAAPVSSADGVAAFLAEYFAAINHRNYRAYVSLFDSHDQTILSEQQFSAGYRSTTDSSAMLVDLSATATGWAATVTFASHQSPAASATHTACTSWVVTQYLESHGNTYLIGPPPAGYRASFQPCP